MATTVERTSSRGSSSRGSSSSGRAATTATTKTPTTSSSSLSSSSQRNNKQVEGECDFFESPTVLSRLILHQKYDAAVRRIKRAPHEVSTWVSKHRLMEEEDDDDDDDDDDTAASPKSPISVTARTAGLPAAEHETSTTSTTTMKKKRKSRVECSYRQLPLHMACSALSRIVDKGLRKQVEALICKLVVAYPEACARRDHQKRMPLHEALWQNALPDTIITVLMAYPEAAQEKDIYGRTTLELNKHRRGQHKEDIAKMLSKSKTFWEFARNEAKLKLKQGSHGANPSSSATIASTSPLTDSLCGDDEYSIITRESIFQGRASTEYREKIKSKGPPVQQSKKTTKWSQLEQRALQLEKLLADRHEENYAMAEEISRLKAVEEKYEQITSDKFLANALVRLEKEKAEMQKQILRMHKVLQRNGLTTEDASLYSKPLEVTVETLNNPKVSSSSSRRKHRPKEISVPNTFPESSPEEHQDTTDTTKAPTKGEFLEDSSSSNSSTKKKAERKKDHHQGKHTRHSDDSSSSTSTSTSSSRSSRGSPASSTTGSKPEEPVDPSTCSGSRGTRSSGSSINSRDDDDEEGHRHDGSHTTTTEKDKKKTTTTATAAEDKKDKKPTESSSSSSRDIDVQQQQQQPGETSSAQSHGSSSSKDKESSRSSTSSSDKSKSSGEQQQQLSELSRKDLERLAKEQEVVDRLREERQYLQSLIDQLSKSSKWRKRAAIRPPPRQRASQRKAPEDVPGDIVLDGEGSIASKKSSSSSGGSSSSSGSSHRSSSSSSSQKLQQQQQQSRRSSPRRMKSRGVTKGTPLLDYSKKISSKGRARSPRKSSSSSGANKGPASSWKSLQQPRKLLTLDDFSDPSSGSESSFLGGELNPIKEEGSECSDQDVLDDCYSKHTRDSRASSKNYRSSATMASF